MEDGQGYEAIADLLLSYDEMILIHLWSISYLERNSAPEHEVDADGQSGLKVKNVPPFASMIVVYYAHWAYNTLKLVIDLESV